MSFLGLLKSLLNPECGARPVREHGNLLGARAAADVPPTAKAKSGAS
jgi:hypothetical protein